MAPIKSLKVIYQSRKNKEIHLYFLIFLKTVLETNTLTKKCSRYLKGKQRVQIYML